MKIQQHDGVVVEAMVISAGLRQALGDGGVSREGEGEARGLGVAALPPLYIGALGGAGPRRWISKGAAAKGWLPPQAKWGAPPPLGFPNPRRRGGPRGGAPAHQGLIPLPLQPMGPSGIGGATRWTPGTLPVVPIQYR